MINLSPAQARVVKAMQEGASFFGDYLGYFLRIGGVSQIVYKSTGRALVRKHIIELMDAKQYTLTDKGRGIEL